MPWLSGAVAEVGVVMIGMIGMIGLGVIGVIGLGMIGCQGRVSTSRSSPTRHLLYDTSARCYLVSYLIDTLMIDRYTIHE